MSSWNTSNLIDASNLFYGCTNLNFTNFDFGKWNLSNVENISGMFYECSNLKEIKEFSKIYNIKNTSFLFYKCIKI